jgi:hypothetical protein
MELMATMNRWISLIAAGGLFGGTTAVYLWYGTLLLLLLDN